MNRNDYIKELEKIEKQYQNKMLSADKALDKLDEMYKYKPVSIKFHVLYSRIMNGIGESENVIKKYAECYSRESKQKDNILLWNQVNLAYEKSGKKYEASLSRYMQSRLLDDNVCYEMDKQLENIRENFINNVCDINILESLEESCACIGENLLAFCIRLYIDKFVESNKDKMNRYSEYANIMYFKERIETGATITVIVEPDSSKNYDILIYLLTQLAIKVYVISESIEIEEDFNLEKSVIVSLDNKQEMDDCIIIPAIAQYECGKYIDDNIPYLVDYISNNMTSEDFSIVIASNLMLEKLRSHRNISKRFERLSDYFATYMEDKIGFGWSGDYYSYLSYLFYQDVQKCVHKKTNVKYSIVVPVRNATDTLYYTLKTCIEQEYDGEYEIVLSDNSVEGHNVAYETYKKINSDKIKYYKTPRDFNLTKSYEYAYLQTKGEYILSIGADDALLPWALSILDVVWDKNSNDRNVIRWDRGFYAWPGFNGGQQHHFVIPAMYKNRVVNGTVSKSELYAQYVKDDPAQGMYALPNMYLNSGFKREYIKKIYEITGRLWDGYAQDIYTGMQNLAIEEDFLYINYPIIIAGMSSSSTGALCTANSIDSINNNKVELVYGGKSIYKIIKSYRDTLVPEMSTDVSALYICIEHLISKGILSKDFYKDKSEICKIYTNCYNSLSIMSDKYERMIYEGYECVKRRDNSLMAWFEKTIMSRMNELRYIESDGKDMKLYKEGFLENGGVVLDASRFGVTNVYEATKLFKDFLHF